MSPWRSARPAVAAAAFACLMLPGCSGPPARPPDREDDGRPGGAGPAEGSTLPAWAVGDAWTYRLDGGEDVTYVVTSETATDWIMETDSPERSFADLRGDVSRLGPQRKSDLAGSQGDERVEFFRWPLRAGMSWETRWDHQEVTVTTQDGGGAGLIALEARDRDGTLVYRYTYDPAVRWFRELHHLDADGSELVGLVLTGSARAWAGSVVRWTLVEVLSDAGNQPPTAAGAMEVPAGTTDIWLGYHFTCTGAAGYTVAIEPSNPGLAAGQRVEDSGPCTQVDWEGPAVEGPHPGTWSFTFLAGGETVAYDFTLLLRTRQDVPVGPA